MEILRVRLQAAEVAWQRIERFYGERLGLSRADAGAALLAFRAGATVLEFSPAGLREPFYHYALRVPRDRFADARDWLARHAGLLPDPDSGETTFTFENWNAEACYTHDPCGNILELIAHHELPDEPSGNGGFDAAELIGMCELGLVGHDTRAMAATLEGAGIGLWDGTVDEPGRLAFMGGRDGVLILSQPGRGWLPTGRPAEMCPVDAVVAGGRDLELALPGTPHRLRTRAVA